MLRQSGPMPEPPKILECRAQAKALRQDLQRELAAMTARGWHGTDQIRAIYDIVYLPRAVALADGLGYFEIPDLDLLRQPFLSERGAAQTAALIGLLNVIVAVLSPS
jgi:hypothetical protein